MEIKPWIINNNVDLKNPDYEFPYGEECEEWGYELINDELEIHLQSINTDRLSYLCCVNNFGWRRLDGVKKIEWLYEDEILGQFLPDTQCSFKIWTTKTGFLLQNFHHDSPCGEEWYEIKVNEEG